MNDQIKSDFTAEAIARGHQGRSSSLVRRFSPYELDDEQVLRQSTGREPLLGRILRVIEGNLDHQEPPNQHLMVLGNRGMGKSFLVRRVQIEVQRLADQGVPLAFVRLPEEQLNVSAPELLLDEIRRILAQTTADTVRVKWRSGDEQEWDASVKALHSVIEKQPGFSEDSGLLVVSIENFDVLLADVFDEDAAQSRLREFLSSEPRIMFLATSTTEADNKHHKRLFQAFRREQIPAWGGNEFVEFYRKTFTGDITESLEAKIRALAHFMGGSPRLAVLIGDVLHTNDALSAVQTLDQLGDELTPYFQDRIMSRLRPKSRWLLDDLLRGGEPCSQMELAKRVGASQSEIAQSFTALLREGVVVDRKHKGKRGQYVVADRVFAHHYRKRYLADESHSPLANLVEFLESFYNPREQAEQIDKLVRADRLDEAQVITETIRQGQPWGDVNEGGRIRSARRLISTIQRCVDGDADDRFWKALSLLATKMAPKHSTESMQDVQQLTDIAQNPVEQIVATIAQAVVHLILPSDELAIELLTDALKRSQKLGHITISQLSLYALAHAEALAGRGASAKQHFAKLLAKLGESASSYLYAEAVADQMWNLVSMKEFDDAEAVFQQTVIDSKLLQNQVLMARLYRLYGYVKYAQNDNKAGLEATERAVELSRQAHDDILLSRAADNLSWFFSHFERHKEALSTARLAREAGERSNDDFLVLNAIHSELSCLNQVSQHQAAIKNAPIALELAKRLEVPVSEAKIQWMLADAYQALNQHNEALSARREAVEASLKSRDINLTTHLHDLLFQDLKVSGSYEEIVERFITWTEQSVDSADTQESENHHIASIKKFETLTEAATFSDRWQEVIDWMMHTPSFSDKVNGATSTIGNAVVELYKTKGASPAFSAMAGFLRALNEPLESERTEEKVKRLFKLMFGTTCGELVAKIPSPGLLQDIAAEVREHLKANDIADMLDALAQYHEKNEESSILDGVDPDIGETIRAVLGIAESSQDETLESKSLVGYARADHLVSEQERAKIENCLTKGNNEWATPPLYVDQWYSPDTDRAVELIVAALGAVRKVLPQSAGSAFSQFSGGVDAFGFVTARALENAKAVRETTPGFYPGWQFAEISVSGFNNNSATFSFLVNDQSIIPMLGKSPPIHELNGINGLSIQENTSVATYLRFFSNAIPGGEGPFRIIDSIEQIPLTEGFTNIENQEIAKLIPPAEVTKQDDSTWRSTQLINYGNALFIANFQINVSGMVEMLDDEHVMTLKNIKRERVASGLRFFDGVFNDDVL